jgi:hypothetical protein
MDKLADKKLVAALAVLLLTVFSAGAYDIKDDLGRLDKVLSGSMDWFGVKEDRLQRLELDLRGVNDPQNQYDLCTKLYDEYYSFQFDKCLETLDIQEEAARSLKDKDLYNQCRLRRASLYCVGGYYKESEAVFSALDTLSFSKDALLLWYDLRQRFCNDFTSGGRPASGMLGQASYYRTRYLQICPENTFDYEFMQLLEYMGTQQFEQAGEIAGRLVSKYSPSSHEYAKAAYYLGVLCDKAGDFPGVIHWYCESAKADIFSAVKDNAALYSISLNLISKNMQVERAFSYTQKALEDAVYYNANLRLIQIVRSLPAIEAAYASERGEAERQLKIAVVVMIALLLSLAVFVVLHTRNHRRLRKTVDALYESKEATQEFLALSLSTSSAYLDKLRPFISRSQMDAELKNFYNSFDTAVLQLYPNFVAEFNSLLLPDKRVVLKPGEILNTELRIYALIRFGVTKSTHIASLLRYSVNTIYNYKTQMKFCAIDQKTPFDEQIMQIGGHK